jgi:hypothetical protein
LQLPPLAPRFGTRNLQIESPGFTVTESNGFNPRNEKSLSVWPCDPAITGRRKTFPIFKRPIQREEWFKAKSCPARSPQRGLLFSV